MKRRDFLKKSGYRDRRCCGNRGPCTLRDRTEKTTIKWRMQTYAGPALAAHVMKPSIDAFNKAANGEMIIELYNADQLVPHGELFHAVQRGTLDACQSDDDSITAPAPRGALADFLE